MQLDHTLAFLANNPGADLDIAELALTLAKEEYPNLDIQHYLHQIEELASTIAPAFSGSLRHRVETLTRFLFDHHRYRGDVEHYYDPRNSYFNQVIDRHLGIPLTLSILAISVGRRAGLRTVGVGLPGHFIAKAIEKEEEVLFDPFHRGRALTPSMCEELVAQITGAQIEATPEVLEGASTASIFVRMLNNLKGIYLKNKDFQRCERVIRRLQQLLPEDVTQTRDMGAVLLNGDQPGRAIRYLEEYLSCHWEAEDREAVEKLLEQARTELARWN